MIRAFAFVTALALLSAGTVGIAQESKTPPKLKALLITGGGYHDYKAINPILTQKIVELARVTFEVKSGLDPLKDAKFADGFDVIVYNFCFDNASEKGMVENALKATKEGKPTVLIHCAMHSFRESEEWTDLCGMRTRRHDPYRALAILKADKEQPILKALPDEWKTPGDELYQTIKLGDRSKVLLRAKGEKPDSEHIVAWTSTYGKGTVFATTLGHDLKTVNLPEYHRLLAHGLLWACGKLGQDGKPAEGYGGTEKK
ncbi:MAG: ThuA domain-containing protein [Gemmataceae bacterium]|nr:ThuA domain-containing protein [Gemmataceae bacterium]